MLKEPLASRAASRSTRDGGGSFETRACPLLRMTNGVFWRELRRYVISLVSEMVDRGAAVAANKGL
jgi:hypothetical protein